MIVITAAVEMVDGAREGNSNGNKGRQWLYVDNSISCTKMVVLAMRETVVVIINKFCFSKKNYFLVSLISRKSEGFPRIKKLKK